MGSARWLLIVWVVLLFALAPLPGGKAWADDTAPNPLTEVSFDQRIGFQAPLDLQFRDDNGTTVHLGDYFGQKPVILQFAYYNCPMLCSLVFSDLGKVIRGLDLKPGDAYEIVTVSIDPREGPELAREKKVALVEDAGVEKAGSAWHFLTGEEPAIKALAGAAGFRYAYDPEIDQWAHPAGLIVLTPQGKISRYFFGLNYSAKDVRLGLIEASAYSIGTIIDQAILTCYMYDPVTGRYNLVIDRVLKLAGIATVGVIAGIVGFFVLQDRFRGKKLKRSNV